MASQTWGEKVLGREGNSPDRLLKFATDPPLKSSLGKCRRKSRLRSSHLIIRAFFLILRDSEKEAENVEMKGSTEAAVELLPRRPTNRTGFMVRMYVVEIRF